MAGLAGGLPGARRIGQPAQRGLSRSRRPGGRRPGNRSLARMPYLRFLAATFSGAYAGCTLLIGAGYLLGHEWALISGYLKQALPFLLDAGLAGLGGYLWYVRRSPKPVEALSWIPQATDGREP